MFEHPLIIDKPDKPFEYDQCEFYEDSVYGHAIDPLH